MGYCKPLAQPNDGQSVPLTALRSSEAASIKLSGGLISGQPGCGPRAEQFHDHHRLQNIA